MTLSNTSPRHEFDYVEGKSCLRAQCNCLCGTGRCRCCSACCPPCKESTSTRLVYILLQMVGVFVMAIFMSEEIQEELIEMFPENFSICEWLGAGRSCQGGRLIGYMAVYRIGLGITLYHLTMMVLTFKVKSSKGCRAGFHNGMWIYKFMLVVITCLGSFFIPDPNDVFIGVWMYVAMAGAALFIIVQLILLVFMIHSWTDKMQKRVSNGGSRFLWFNLVGPCTALLTFIICGHGVYLLYAYFAAEEGCHRNQWFILTNAVACIIISIVSCAKKSSKPWGLRLLHASLISLYVIYLTWNAISSAPRRFQRRGFNRPIHFGGRTDASSRFRFAANQPFYCGPNGDEETMSDKVIPYVSFVITLVTVLYGSIGISESKKCRALELPDCPRPQANADHEKDDSGGQIIVRNEKLSLVYNYSLFHFMMAIANLLMMMHLTAWHTPSAASLMNFGRSWSAVWIKMSSSWVCLLIYFITILCPSVLPSKRVGVMMQVEEEDVHHVKANGHALEREEEEEESDVDECAVPLTPVRRPFNFNHQETTV